MKIRRLKLCNFRGIKALELDLDDMTVLIGENNSGKTACLDALRLCLREIGPRRSVVFDAFDFHLKDAAADVSSADPIEITISFSEDAVGEWDAQMIRSLNRSQVLQVDGNGRNHVVLRITCAYDSTNGEFDQQWSFLNLANQPLVGASRDALSDLQREVTYFYLSALRDAARHFDPKGQFWRPFLRDSQLADDKKTEIERKLKEVNDLVVGSHTSFAQVRSGLNQVQQIVPMAAGDIVSIEAVPTHMFDVLAKAQIQLGTSSGAKVPVGRHGEGTQSLAVLMLFSAFLDTRQAGAPIVALEEPEAHLHPSAVRALWGLLNNMAGQKLITTHSGDLLSEVPARALRRLGRTATGIEVFRLGANTLSADDERKFNFHIRSARGELLFARCWLLVEGETEATLFPEIARHLGIHLEKEGIRCVTHRQSKIELFLKVARDFGIRWCALCDNDGQGVADQGHVRNYVGGGNVMDMLHVIPESNIEAHLCAAGFGSVYEAYLSPQTLPLVTAQKNSPQYWPQVMAAIKNIVVKPAAALAVVEMIRSGAVPVPPLLENALRKGVALAKGA